MSKKHVLFFLISLVLASVTLYAHQEAPNEYLIVDDLNTIHKEIAAYVNNKNRYGHEPLRFATYRHRIVDDFLRLHNKVDTSSQSNDSLADDIQMYNAEKYLMAFMTINRLGLHTAARHDAYTLDDAVSMIHDLVMDFVRHPEHFSASAGTALLGNCKKLLDKAVLLKADLYKTTYVLAYVCAQESDVKDHTYSIALLNTIITTEEQDRQRDELITEMHKHLTNKDSTSCRIYDVDEALANKARVLSARILMQHARHSGADIQSRLQKVAYAEYAFPEDRDAAEKLLKKLIRQ